MKTITKKQIEDEARKYPRFVEWSDEDQCFIGSAPPVIGQSCHGRTSEEVVKQIDAIVNDWVETYLAEGKQLPNPLQKTYSGKFVMRIAPMLHKKLALQAAARGDSLNQFIEKRLTESA